ncbi:MAG: rod shape-determining protein RodA, partial [Acetobacteraceae bacterium]|nr:rod shape-determining protein RodA [Acetobacteraceae bacterium]
MIFERRLLTESRGAGLVSKLWRVPWLFVLLLSGVAAIGYVALWTAGSGNVDAYAQKHALRFGFCLVIMLSIAFIDIRLILRFAWLGYAVALGLLVLVLFHGNVGKGAQRWIDIGPVQLQPSELMKIMLALGLAAWFHRASWERMGNPLFLIPPALMVLLPVGLILKQPNLGTALITAMIGAAVFWAAGMRWWKFALMAGAAAIAAPIAYENLRDYQRARITTFLDPESDPLGAGYNIIQAKIALGSGGWAGKGFMQGTQSRLNFLPEKHTDFIFTTLAEEFGFVGAFSLLVLYALILIFLIVAAIQNRDRFSQLLIIGVAVNFFLYLAINLAMVMGMAPVVGVPLPLLSY